MVKRFFRIRNRKYFRYLCISFFLLVSIVSSLLVILILKKTYKKEEKEKKNAIIIVPGIAASVFFYNGDNDKFFKKGQAIVLRDGLSLWESNTTIKFIEYILDNYKVLSCSEEGLPINTDYGLLQNNEYVSQKDLDLSSYGILLMFKTLIQNLENQFGKKTVFKNDIFLFNYDWRLDCEYNAKLLMQEIEKYDNVILLWHSMGGLISCKALVNLNKRYLLDKVKAVISVMTPYNGATRTIRAFKTGFLDSGFIFNNISENFGWHTKFKELISNYPSMYQLLPTKEYFNRSGGCLKKDRKPCLSYLDMLDYLKNDLQLNKQLINRAVDFHDSLFIKNKHILEYIKNRYFFVGTGYKVMSELTIKPDDYDFYISKYVDGDETVALNYSAIPPLENIKNEKIYKMKARHVGIFSNSKFLSQINYIIENELTQNNGKC